MVDRENDQAKVCSVLQLDPLTRSKRTQRATRSAQSSTEEGGGDDDDSPRHIQVQLGQVFPEDEQPALRLCGLRLQPLDQHHVVLAPHDVQGRAVVQHEPARVEGAGHGGVGHRAAAAVRDGGEEEGRGGEELCHLSDVDVRRPASGVVLPRVADIL